MKHVLSLDNYLQTRQKLKATEDEYRNDFVKSGIVLNNAIHKLTNDSDYDIPFWQLKTFPLNEEVVVSVGHTVIKYFDDGNVLKFKSEMKQGAHVSKHFHSDCDEHMHVDSGIFFDMVSNTQLKEGESIFFRASKNHSISAIQDLKLTTIVTKLK